MTSAGKQLEIQFEDPNPQKWSHPLKEDVFANFVSKENSAAVYYKTGSFFSPLLFGKFFDPSDAFPLWEFESDALLPNSYGSGHRSVDWYQTETDYVLLAEVPGLGQNSLQVCIENGKILEISGQWRQQQRESRAKDWRSGKWWEHGYVRRLELPEQTGWRRAEAHMKNDVVLEIRIPKTAPDSDQGN
ncbi:class VI heat shock protein [Sesamum angolense]|uniref:Class VI heat shock protein n=1 Tax=Sesamum angolense TaxID=2727404 RepID=A0AAE1W582_9LAMI|nr:class VI heat shock protein [Sesamum angolense]